MTVEIRVSTRPHWYQVSAHPIDSDELADHLGHLALGEWARWHRRRNVEVIAHDRDGPLEAHVLIPAIKPVRIRLRRRRT